MELRTDHVKSLSTEPDITVRELQLFAKTFDQLRQEKGTFGEASVFVLNGALTEALGNRYTQDYASGRNARLNILEAPATLTELKNKRQEFIDGVKECANNFDIIIPETAMAESAELFDESIAAVEKARSKSRPYSS